MSESDAQPKQTGPLASFLAGGFGGSCLVIVGQPLDTIKVRIQTMEVVPGKPPPYKGLVDCAMKSMKAEGPFALYKGMAAPLAGVTPMYAMCFLGYGVGKNVFCDPDAFDPNNLKLGQIAAAGATSAVFTTPILAPGERLKCVMQTQQGQFKGNADVVKHLYKEGGIRSLTRGLFATCARDSVASAFYFSTYEVLKGRFTREGESSPGVAGTLAAGGFAGIANWMACMPIDTLKSRYQVAPHGKYSGTVLGSRSVLKELLREQGVAALYRGFIPVMARAFPANAACFFGYEFGISTLKKFGIE